MSIVKLLASDNYIVVNKVLIKLFGLEEAILLAELCSEHTYWENRGELNDGYFYSTVENIEFNTTLSDHKQRKCIKSLTDFGVISTELRGMPAKRYIRINQEKLDEILQSQFLKNLRTSSEKIKDQVLKNFQLNNNISNNNKYKKTKITKVILSKKDQTYLDHVLAKCDEYGFTEQVVDLIMMFFEDKVKGKKYYGDNYLDMQFIQLTKFSEEDKIAQITRGIKNGYNALSYIDEDTSSGSMDNCSQPQKQADKENVKKGVKF